jgi:hypothetical protein
MTSLFSGQSGAQSFLGGTGLSGPSIPPPPSFTDFRFTTIGQEPELLKRISAPRPDFQYQDDRLSPTPSLSYPSQNPEPPLSRPSLLQALTDPSDQVNGDMNGSADGMVIDIWGEQTQAHQTNETKNIQLPATSNPANSQGPRGWSEQVNGSNIKPLPTKPRSSTPFTAEDNATNSNQPFQEIFLEFSNATTQVHQVNTLPKARVPSSTPNPISTFPTNGITPPPRRSSSLLLANDESKYTSLRALQIRLMSSLSNLNAPDTSNALLLVQAANTHSANALSTAHRSHTLAQQALASAREAVAAAQECLSAAEQAKQHASDAVIAVEQVGTEDARGSKSEWEWKTIISGLQDDLHALGEWVGEREGEEAAKRRETERTEKAKRDKDSVDTAMRMVDNRLSPQVVQAMAAEVMKRTVEEEARSRPKAAQDVQTSPPPIQREKELHRAAELEADDARRAWSLEHGHPPRPRSTATTEVEPGAADETREQARRSALDAAALIKQTKLKEELQKREEEARVQQEQQQQREAEIKAQRVRELELQKLEVARFRILERERQARQEADREEADALHVRQEADQRKRKEAEAAEARRQEQRQRQKAVSGEQAKAAASQAAALKEKILAMEADTKAAVEAEVEARAAEKQAEEARTAEAKAAEARETQARTAAVREAEARAAEAKATETRVAQQQAAARAGEAREVELREAQSRKRQEVMAQKQRASAETAARILAERARERELNDTSAPPTHHSGSPETSMSITHLLPSVFQTAPLPPTIQTETAKSKARSISGGVRLGTSEEPTENSVPSSPSLLRTMALGLRSRKEGRPIPLPLPVPRPKAKLDKKEGLTPTQPASTPVTPPTGSTELPDPGSNQTVSADHVSVHRRSRDSGNIPIVPCSQLPPTSPEVQAANLRFVRDASGVSLDTFLKRDPHTTIVKPEPQAEQKLSSPSPGAKKRKVKDQAGPAPKRSKVRQDAGLTKVDKEPDSPIIPPTPVVTSPSAVAPPLASSSPTTTTNLNPTFPTPNTTPQSAAQSTISSNIAPKHFTASVPIPPRMKQKLPNFRTRKLNGASVESPAAVTHTPTQPFSNATYPTSAIPDLPPAAPRALAGTGKRPPSQGMTNISISALVPGLPKSTTQVLHQEPAAESNPPQATPSDLYRASAPNPQRATTPNPYRMATANQHRESTPNPYGATTAGSDQLPTRYDDASQIAPALHGDGGWNAPTQPDEESYHNSFRARDDRPRQYLGGDHYSPPVRTPPRAHSPTICHPPLNMQETHRPTNTRYVSGPVRPVLHITTAPPGLRSRTPTPRTPSPPPKHSPAFGKRRRVDDEPPSHRYRQDDAERERTDHLFRPRFAHTPPPSRPIRRSPTPEHFGGLQSRIGARDTNVYGGGQNYRPSYPSDSYAPPPRRVSDSYQPVEFTHTGYKLDFGLNHAPLPGHDRYVPGRIQVAEGPDLLDRMFAGTSTRARGGSTLRGNNRGRGGRGGGRPLEQRISSNNSNNNTKKPMSLMNRLESPP